jgi:hypothetical protein
MGAALLRVAVGSVSFSLLPSRSVQHVTPHFSQTV